MAAADVNGDTRPDLVWRNTSTGANVVWYLNGTAILNQASLPSVPDLAWQIVAAADVNGDMHPNLIWRNAITGTNVVWYSTPPRSSARRVCRRCPTPTGRCARKDRGIGVRNLTWSLLADGVRA